MTNIQIFENNQFGQVRIISENGKVLFCGSDVARALGYSRPNDAVSAHCRSTVKRRIATSQGNEADMSFIPESDLYRLMVKSQLPDAEKFERWVFEEVLPSVRQTGAYMTPETIEKVLLNPDTIINLATQIKKLQAKVQADAPKVLFASAVEASHTSILVGDLAKLIRQNGVEIGQKRLFQWMRDNGYLMKAGASYNLPTQYSMERGWMEIKESSISNPDGSVRVTKTTKITGKGQTYFVNALLVANQLQA